MQREQCLFALRQYVVRYMMQYKAPAGYVIESYQCMADRVRVVIKKIWRIYEKAKRIQNQPVRDSFKTDFQIRRLLDFIG